MYLILSLLTIPLATWRLSDMLSDTGQSGPFGILDWIRSKLGVKYNEESSPYANGSIAEGALCIMCNSVWFGVFFTVLLLCNQEVTFFVSLPFALSAMAILIEDWRNRA